MGVSHNLARVGFLHFNEGVKFVGGWGGNFQVVFNQFTCVAHYCTCTVDSHTGGCALNALWDILKQLGKLSKLTLCACWPVCCVGLCFGILREQCAVTVPLSSISPAVTGEQKPTAKSRQDRRVVGTKSPTVSRPQPCTRGRKQVEEARGRGEWEEKRGENCLGSPQ